MSKMNVDDPKLTAYALDELDESERSAIARATAGSPEMQRFVADTQDLARALRSQYRLELQRGLVAPEKLRTFHGDTFWPNAGPLAIAALIAILAVIGAVMFSGKESHISAPTGLSLSRDSAGQHANQFAAVEAEDAARPSQNEKFEADAGPYAFTGERPFVSVTSRPWSSVPLVVNSASYLDVRRSIDAGLLPPRESVRIEGMINHFPYEYSQPTAGEPFSLNLAIVTCPWEPTHRLVRIGLKGHQDVAVRADSRIEVEFNPRRVASYRLIGYDRQKTETQNSNEDDVGSHPMGAGYTLTTLYEVVPLKRMGTATRTQMLTVAEAASEPLLTAKLQLKTRGNDAAIGLIQRTLSDTGFDFATAPSDLKFAAAVAEFGMILRDSEYKGNGSLQQVIEWAQQGTGVDVNGCRADFIELVRKAQALKRS
ncbi:MAG TPA: von Willebrand factor type A domain-containing protein [Candidatus Udaeobacter sp.]